jgi:hypothetical protein
MFDGPSSSIGFPLQAVIPGPRSGTRNPDAQAVPNLTLSAALDCTPLARPFGSGLACGAPE